MLGWALWGKSCLTTGEGKALLEMSKPSVKERKGTAGVGQRQDCQRP